MDKVSSFFPHCLGFKWCVAWKRSWSSFGIPLQTWERYLVMNSRNASSQTCRCGRRCGGLMKTWSDTVRFWKPTLRPWTPIVTANYFSCRNWSIKLSVKISESWIVPPTLKMKTGINGNEYSVTVFWQYICWANLYIKFCNSHTNVSINGWQGKRVPYQIWYPSIIQCDSVKSRWSQWAQAEYPQQRRI